MGNTLIYATKTSMTRSLAGVAFVDGVASVDPATHGAQIALFQRLGYTVTADEAMDPDTISITTVKPTLAATRQELADFAASLTPPVAVADTDTKKAILEKINAFDDGSAPAITTQPVAASVANGAEATFTVVATGAPAPTYQWDRQVHGAGEWVAVDGATAASLVVTAATADSTDKYRVVVSNIKGSVISDAVALTVT